MRATAASRWNVSLHALSNARWRTHSDPSQSSPQLSIGLPVLLSDVFPAASIFSAGEGWLVVRRSVRVGDEEVCVRVGGRGHHHQWWVLRVAGNGAGKEGGVEGERYFGVREE